MSNASEINIATFLKLPLAEQLDRAWYDWFCSDSQLKNRGKKLVVNLLTLVPSTKIDLEKHYVFFKNNCPMDGSLYDDFRICEIGTGNVIYTIVPSNGHSHTRLKGKAMVYGRENQFAEPLAQGEWMDIIQYFRSNNGTWLDNQLSTKVKHPLDNPS